MRLSADDSGPIPDGAVERRLHVARSDREFPVEVWSGAGTGSDRPPLLLLGHGGSGHRRSPRVRRIARRFARHGVTAAAIDGPFHGERVEKPLSQEEVEARIAAEGADRVVTRMTDDWLAAVEAVGRAGIADTERVAYFGLSMGTRYGLPCAAALGGRLVRAVFGKFGIGQDAPTSPASDMTTTIVTSAAMITAPTLFHVQWDDEVFPRDGQLRLFDHLGSVDKVLLARRGRHTDTHPDAESAWIDFLAAGLEPGRHGPR